MGAFLLRSATIVALLITGCSNRDAELPIPFNREQWRKPPNEHTQKLMAKHMVASQMLVGMPRSEVIALLGTPAYAFDAAYGGRNIQYDIGDAEGFGPGFLCLFVYFSEGDIVLRCAIGDRNI